jgi:hypothetical protein
VLCCGCVMREIMILSHCFVNIQSTFHLPPKRAAQHAFSPQLFRRQLSTRYALLPLWILSQGLSPTERWLCEWNSGRESRTRNFHIILTA